MIFDPEINPAIPRTAVGYGSLCPTCGWAAVSVCRCQRADTHCKYGHYWHRCTVHNRLVVGQSDHAKKGCTCKSATKELPNGIP